MAFGPITSCFSVERDFKFYLNEGSGSPCAGQVIPKPSPDDFSKVEEDKIEENFGFVNPIGSKFTKKKSSEKH